jgi:hypothetical protein
MSSDELPWERGGLSFCGALTDGVLAVAGAAPFGG